jgi:hypothetical protein
MAALKAALRVYQLDEQKGSRMDGLMVDSSDESTASLKVVSMVAQLVVLSADLWVE